MSASMRSCSPGAMRDEELRGLLSEAERQLNFGEFRSAFRYADQALLNARVLWRSQREGKYETTREILHPPGFSSLPAAAGDPLDRSKSRSSPST